MAEARESYEETENRFNDLFDEYVPAQGAAETVGGEIVRAVSRIGYRLYNDGDIIGCGYGNQTLNGPARYLQHVCEGTKIADDINEMWGNLIGCESLVKDLIEDTVEYLDVNPELFEKKNEENMLNYCRPEDERYDDEDDEDDWETDEDEDDWEEEA